MKDIAKQIIDYCNPIAEKQNLEYYPFQSPLNLDTDVLIIGINPRSEGDHKSQLYNSKWDFDEAGRMKIENLLRGNPYYLDDKAKWRFFYNLKQISFLKDKIEEGKYTYMNYFYFSTKDANGMRKIKGFGDILEFCRKQLYNIIQELQPKLVLLLGVKDGLDLISDIRSKTLFHKGNNRILTEGSINDAKIYAIPHSSRNYAYDVRECLDINLRQLYNKTDLLPYDFKVTNQKIKTSSPKFIDVVLLNSLLKEYFQFKPFNNKVDLYSAQFTSKYGDVLDIRLDTSRKGYLAIRGKDKVGGSFYNYLKGLNNYVSSANGIFEIERSNWLLYKSLSDNLNYSNNLEERLAQEVMQVLGIDR